MNILSGLLDEAEVGSPGGVAFREKGLPHDAAGPIRHWPSCALFLPLCLPAPFVQAHISGQH